MQLIEIVTITWFLMLIPIAIINYAFQDLTIFIITIAGWLIFPSIFVMFHKPEKEEGDQEE